MGWLRAFFRFIGFCTLAAAYITHGQIIRWKYPDIMERRRQLLRLISAYSRITLRMMGFRVFVKDLNEYEECRKSRLFASNHMSYIDVLVLASRFPGAFVTSLEIKNTPFLGLLTELGGCLYVDRRSKSGLSAEVADLTGALRSGLDVLFFPEATSTNGESVIRFRRPLFQSAIDAESPVQPVTLNYQSISGQNFSTLNRDIVCWYGDMPFLSHLLKLFAQKEVTVFVSLHERIETKGKDITELAGTSHKIVSDGFQGCGDKSILTTATKSSFSAERTFFSMDSASSSGFNETRA